MRPGFDLRRRLVQVRLAVQKSRAARRSAVGMLRLVRRVALAEGHAKLEDVKDELQLGVSNSSAGVTLLYRAWEELSSCD